MIRFSTTQDFIDSFRGDVPTGTIFESDGYLTSGDGGEGKWFKTALTSTASRAPSQMVDAKLTDASGHIWELVYQDTINIKQLGGNLESNNGAVVFAFNASSASTLDLCSEEWPAIDIDCDNATDRAKLLKSFINGSLITHNSFDSEVNIQTLQNANKDEIRVSGRKSQVLTWKDKRVLWLGTSIPHQGVGFDGYPEQFASLLDCTVLNWAWSGSHAFYDVAGSSSDINTTKALSMTEADRLSGLATYGAGSAYSDTFDAINKPSEMTVDYRIKNQFIAGAVDVVILDHNHNDRKLAKTYTLNPKTITGVTKGATTVLTVTNTTGYSVGNAAYLEIAGIDNLNFAAARISAVTSNTVTLQIDSSGYAGTFSSGTINWVDRATIAGAFDFLIAYIKNMGVIYGNSDVDVVLCNSPSYCTNNANRDYSIWSSGKVIKGLAEKWGLGYYDVAADLDLDYSQHLTYFPDSVHPSTKETRVSMANHWAAWCSGGKQSVINRADVVEKNKLIADVDDAPVLYSRFDGKYASRETLFGLDANIIEEDFSGGIGTWTVVSTAPVIGAAPWNGAEFAAQFNPTVIAASPYITKSCAAGFEPRLQFSFYIPDTDVATGASQQMTIADLTAGATNYGIGVVQSAGSDMRLRVFRTDTNIAYAGINNFIIQPNTKYEVVVDIIKGATDSDDGYIYISVNGVDIVANQFDNGGVGSITSLRIGSVFNNFASAFNFYISDIVATSKTRSETPQWFHAIDSMPAQFNTFAQAQAAGLTKTNQRIIVVERANANYLLQAAGYVALAGDLTLSNGRVAALQIDGKANVKWFGAVGNGVTDDHPAIQLALSRTPYIYIPAGNYAIYDVIRVRGKTTADVEYFGIRGSGRETTRILQKDNSKNGIVIEKSVLNADVNKWMTGEVTDLSVVYVGAVKSDACTAINHTSCLGILFQNINIEGATRAFASFGCGQTIFNNVTVKHGQRPALEGPEFDFLFTNNGTISRSFGISMSNCEVFEAPLSDVCLELKSLDGIYINNCHFNSAINKVRINIDNVDLRDVVKQVFFNNVYFDGNTDASLTTLESVVYVQSSGVAGATVDGIYFNNCIFRVGTSVFSFNPSMISGLEFFRELFINNCNARGIDSSWVNLSMGDGRELAVISNIQISDNVFEDAPLSTPTDNLNCIVGAGNNLSITGNIIKGQWVDGVAAPILINANSNNVIISSNIMDTDRSNTVGNKNIVVNASATNVIQANNLPI